MLDPRVFEKVFDEEKVTGDSLDGLDQEVWELQSKQFRVCFAV